MLAALALAAPANADEDFDWKVPSTRVSVHSALHRMSEICSEFGFTPMPEQTPTVMSDKLESMFLLSDYPDGILQRWAEMLRGLNFLNKDFDDTAMVERLSDAIIAAKKDPESYASGEALFVRTLMSKVDEGVGACRKGAADPFVSKYYWSGTGNGDRFLAQAKRQFAESVADTDDGKGE